MNWLRHLLYVRCTLIGPGDLRKAHILPCVIAPDCTYNANKEALGCTVVLYLEVEICSGMINCPCRGDLVIMGSIGFLVNSFTRQGYTINSCTLNSTVVGQ